MDFDQIGVQHISRRRRPSPLRSAKYRTASDDPGFSQKVSPRRGKAGANFRFEKTLKSLFKKKSSRQSGNPQAEDILHQEVSERQPAGLSAGFSIPASWVKTAAVVCGVLVISVVGPNWDSISGRFNFQGVSPDSLLDPADAPPIMWGGIPAMSVEPSGSWMQDVSNEVTQDSPVPLEEALSSLTKLFSSTEYQVQPGDSISLIAANHSLSMESVIAFNGLKDSIVRVGTKLKIPNMNGIPYTVRKNDTIIKIAEREKISVNSILDANDLRSDTIVQGQVLFLPGARMNSAEYRAVLKPRETMISPLSGRMIITSNYGMRLDPVNPRSGTRRFHEGIDLRAAWGATVKAAMGGFVEERGTDRVFGNFIILNHGDYRSMYAHLSSFSVKKGAQIKQGQEIGKVGNTGYTTGAHLHFAVYDRNGKHVNPNGLLR